MLREPSASSSWTSLGHFESVKAKQFQHNLVVLYISVWLIPCFCVRVGIYVYVCVCVCVRARTHERTTCKCVWECAHERMALVLVLLGWFCMCVVLTVYLCAYVFTKGYLYVVVIL